MSKSGQDASEFVQRLADKWHEVPLSRLERASTRSLIEMQDAGLLAAWEQARVETSDGLRGLTMRGWFHRVYGDSLAGKKILEVGQGLGIDGVALAQHGCRMTFVDVSLTNLRLVQRIFALKSLLAPEILHLEAFELLDRLGADYDFVVAFGSLHHIPADVGKGEFEALSRRLKPGGRFIMHAYPRQRWIDEGQLPFEQWGEKTDGVGTPWAEWYDTRKVIRQLRPARFAPLLYCEYHDGAMNCIDLIKIDGDRSLQDARLPDGAASSPDAVALDEFAVHSGWDAQLAFEPDGSPAITTPEAPWAYAASAPIHRGKLPEQSPGFFVRVSATVREGRVGIGVLTTDGREFLAEEYLAADDDESATCMIEVPVLDGKTADQIVVRNASPRPGRSRIVIHSIEIFCL